MREEKYEQQDEYLMVSAEEKPKHTHRGVRIKTSAKRTVADGRCTFTGCRFRIRMAHFLRKFL